MKVFYTDFDKAIEYHYKSSKPYQLTNSIIVIVDYTTVDGNRRLRFRIPHGFRSDGCSIPFIFWGLIGCPHTGKYIPASIVHDYLLEHPRIAGNDLKKITEIFKQMLINEGTNKLTANIMTLCVYWYQRIIRRDKWDGKRG